MFWSIGDTWKSVLSLPSDVKELVPEFYSNDPSFLVGGLHLCCGLWTAKRSTARPASQSLACATARLQR